MLYSRRDLLRGAGAGFGWAALGALRPEGRAFGAAAPAGKARSVIYIFNHGGVSHVDTFDPKPALKRWEGQPLSREMATGLRSSFIDFKKAIVRGSPWRFRPCGESGIEISELFPHVSEHADDLAVIRSCQSDVFDHAPAIYHTMSGSQFPGRPSLGAWLMYGLGSENKNLPGFVVMADGALKSGPQAFGAGFLPAAFQGTVFRGGGTPVLHLAAPPGVNAQAQRATLDFIAEMNRRHLASRSADSTLEARIAAYELAFRMQSAAPEAVDLDAESAATKRLYGVGEEPTDAFGRRCLLARRLIERGVRCVQIFAGTHLSLDWDAAHEDLVGSHTKMAARTDRPVAGLLADLRGRGLLDSTMVVWNSEFGRTPVGQGKNGRDHHPYGYSMWMAGGGVRGGQVLGATDDLGLRATESPFSVHDVNATILRLLGADHTKLTFRFQSREQRLTDVHGEHEFTSRLVK